MRKALYEASPDTNYLKIEEAVRYFNLCASTIKKIAKDCNAKVKIGQAARFKKDVLENYINSMNEGK